MSVRSRQEPPHPTLPPAPEPGRFAAARTAATRPPSASHVPRPYTTPFSSRTGISPSTVSMCPRKATRGGPDPIRAIPFPTASTSARKPIDDASAMNTRTASASSPDGLYALTSRTRASASSTTEHPSERIERVVPLLLRDHEGREEAEDVRPRADREHPLGGEVHEVRRGLLPQLDADHQPKPADLPDRGRVDPAQPLDRAGPERFGPLPELLLHRVIDPGAPRGAREGVAAKGGVVASRELRLHRRGRQRGPDRHAPREGLRERGHVRVHAPPLAR